MDKYFRIFNFLISPYDLSLAFNLNQHETMFFKISTHIKHIQQPKYQHQSNINSPKFEICLLWPLPVQELYKPMYQNKNFNLFMED